MACGAQKQLHMAAVLALVMLPLLAAIGFFAGVTRSDGSMVSALAMLVFAALGTGVLVGALRVLRDGEPTL